jgi:hypothetical protein
MQLGANAPLMPNALAEAGKLDGVDRSAPKDQENN